MPAGTITPAACVRHVLTGDSPLYCHKLFSVNCSSHSSPTERTFTSGSLVHFMLFYIHRLHELTILNFKILNFLHSIVVLQLIFT